MGEFKDQGGAASMSPSPIFRWLSSKVISKFSSLDAQLKRHKLAEKERQNNNLDHCIEYFHQVDDGYSYLASQCLEKLAKKYDVSIRCHLVSGPVGKNSAEPDLLLKLSAYDSSLIASQYDLAFPSSNTLPQPVLVERAKAILAKQTSEQLTLLLPKVSKALWEGDESLLISLADEYGAASSEEVSEIIENGSNRQKELKHYSGAMFFYGNEWYWGVDRLHHLEKRLSALNLDNHPAEGLAFPRPNINFAPSPLAETLTLEIYPSLRSPYTGVIFDTAIKLAKSKGVKIDVRPVLPMVMRGVPATREKGFYIFSDAAREARDQNIPFGNMYDPIGDPVRNCYSLYPWAKSQDKDIDLISAFLKAAFVDGISTNRKSGIRKVVESAGLDWQEAQSHLGSNDWEAILEANRLTLYKSGLWGVPSFRLLGPNQQELLSIWGQDRLWLVAQAIDNYQA